ncbi:hypothetical protein [Microbacterium sp.]|uniref:hypothetical protein n=1 Tax=Microbacterium sp. TaxID=51671 RepID=UPI002733A685|nr:hypothetical protein [Microbacterium sp.]MDP3951167.1 hypothetical protein [Microbacterium sp.]
MKKRAAWIAAGAIAAVAVAASLVWFLIPRGSAEDQALAYLQAVADGDVAAVEATGLDVPATTASAFADASDRLSEGAIVSSTADDHSAVVTVSYELAGTRHESTLKLSQREGHWVPNAATAFGSVQYSVAAGIAGTVLPADRVALLPAVYEVSAAPAEFLDGSATVEVLPGVTQEVDVDATLRPEAADAAQAQLDEYLATCTKPAAETLPSCGIAIPLAADFSAVSEIRYRIEQTPVVALTPSAFQADGGVLVATVTGTALDGSTKTLTYRSTNWTVRGDVTFTDDDIVLSVW